MPIESEQFELSTHDNMQSETRYDPPLATHGRTEQEEAEVLLSEGENDKNAEMLRKYYSPIVCCTLFPHSIENLRQPSIRKVP